MHLGVRTRLTIWILVVIAAGLATGYAAIYRVESQTLHSASAAVLNVQDLEIALDGFEADTASPDEAARLANAARLVVEADKGEALAPVQQLRRTLLAGGGLALSLLLLGWVVFVDPISRRLRSSSLAAERVAGGDYQSPIGDRSSDEIGRLSQAIDRLAGDLANDRLARSEAEQLLIHQATRDEVTGLFNRQHASTLLAELAVAAKLKGERFSLLFLDMDGFKNINDTYGHKAGDEVLGAIGGRLNQATPDDALVARWGGDEFVIVLPSATEMAADRVAEDITRCFEDPIVTTSADHRLSCSIGSSTLGTNGSVQTMLHEADSAMFAQKQLRSGQRGVPPETVRLIEAALEDGRVEVWYQPIVSLHNGAHALVGAEALVRLRDTDQSIVTPDRFIPRIQGTQLGRALDHAVITMAIDEVATWITEGSVRPDFRLSVNFGDAMVRDHSAADFVAGRLVASGMDPANLIVELSETATIAGSPSVELLHAAGIGLAIDDVGLDQSNADRLIDSGASIAKIDRRWVDALSQGDAREGQVAHHLISMCASLGIAVIAEGIETQRHQEAVIALGVQSFQGYLFGRPLPGHNFVDAHAGSLSAATI